MNELYARQRRLYCRSLLRLMEWSSDTVDVIERAEMMHCHRRRFSLLAARAHLISGCHLCVTHRQRVIRSLYLLLQQIVIISCW